MKYRLFDTPQPLSGPSQASIDAGFRHRSRAAQGASVIQSIELKELNEKGRRTVVHDLVSICRRRSEEVQLSLHCAFARDEKACFLHGTEEEWRAEIAKGGDAKDAALRQLRSYPIPTRSAGGGGHRGEGGLHANAAQGVLGFADLARPRRAHWQNILEVLPFSRVL